MRKVNCWAVVAATVAAFIAGASWSSSSVLGETRIEVRGLNPDAMAETSPSAGELIRQFASNPVIIYSLAQVVVRLGASGWNDAMDAGSWVRAGLQGTRLLGVVLHVEIPWKLCAFSAGHGLTKTLFASVLDGGWRW
jgi:hypothetical protein